MKQSVKLGLLILLLSRSAFAVNTPSGWYGGLFLGPSASGSITLNTSNPLTNRIEAGHLVYSVFGYIGGEAGFRLNLFRDEGQLFFNSAPYHQITFNNLKLSTSDRTQGVHMKGQTNTAAFMLNGFYDIMNMTDSTYWVPYLGLGIGYAEIYNNIKLYSDKVFIGKYSKNGAAPLAQGILGLNYFLDDFFWVGFDYRYITSQKIEHSNSRIRINAVTISVGGSISCL